MRVSENIQKKLLEDFEKFEKEEIRVGKNEKMLKVLKKLEDIYLKILEIRKEK
jgi:hypothetical protein